jgi:hypothetical protein
VVSPDVGDLILREIDGLRTDLTRVESKVDKVGEDSAETRVQATKTNGTVAALKQRVDAIEDREQDQQDAGRSSRERWIDRIVTAGVGTFGALCGLLAAHL